MPRLQYAPPRLPATTSRLPTQSADEAERSRQRAAEAPWRAWYKSARWQQVRERVFTRDLFGCQMLACGKVISNRRQLVCDHIRPHRGDPALFWDEDNLQTLCKPCHDGAKQSAERRAR